MIGLLSKFDIEKFDGKDFSLRKMKVEGLLVQNDQAIALKRVLKKPNDMVYQNWVKLDRKAVSTICLCLADSILFIVTKENTA